MKRILFLSHLSTLGGAEKCLYLLLQGLPRDQYQPFVALPSEGVLTDAIRALGIETRLVTLRWWIGQGDKDDGHSYRVFAEGLADRVESICRIIREERIDVVFTNTSTVVDGALAAARCKVPHVWHVHELLSQDRALIPLLPLRHFYHLLSELSSSAVVVSEAVKREINQFCPTEKIQVVYNGLEDVVMDQAVQSTRQELLGIPDNVSLVVSVGLLSERKGVLDLVDAASRVHSQLPSVRFILVGPDGGEAQNVLARVRSYGMEGSVQWLGPRDDVSQILSVCDLFVLPSIADPLPLVLLEAMRAGLPIVATRSGGSTEMLCHEDSGYLVPVGQPSCLADGILHLLSDPAKRRVMGAHARERFLSCFSVNQYVVSMTRLLDSVGKNAKEQRPMFSGGGSSCLEELLEDVAIHRANAARDGNQVDRLYAEKVRLEAELQVAESEWARLRTLVQVYSTSTSYRLGRAITRLKWW